MRHWFVQLKDAATGEAIISTGGKCLVVTSDDTSKQAIVDRNGAAMTNPLSLTRGSMEFWVASNSVTEVDLYIQCPGGQFVVRADVKASGPNEILVDTSRFSQVLVYPFSQADFSANTETDTGFDEPAGARWLADSTGAAVLVTTIDATETVDFGTATAETGDPDGFVSAASLANAALVLDNGALLVTLTGHASTSKSLVITTSAGSDTGKGYIFLPYILMQAP